MIHQVLSLLVSSTQKSSLRVILCCLVGRLCSCISKKVWNIVQYKKSTSSPQQCARLTGQPHRRGSWPAQPQHLSLDTNAALSKLSIAPTQDRNPCQRVEDTLTLQKCPVHIHMLLGKRLPGSWTPSGRCCSSWSSHQATCSGRSNWPRNHSRYPP